MDLDERSVWLGERLRQLRQERHISLDALADLTGVSKPMLSQIERGVSNPTVATLWKIADGLEVPFTTFIMERPTAHVLRASEQPVFYEDDRRFAAYSTYSAAGVSPVELFRVLMQPGCKRVAQAHARGVIESITVTSGCLHMEVQETGYVLRAGDSMHFQADVTHVYANVSKAVCEVQMAILYPRVALGRP